MWLPLIFYLSCLLSVFVYLQELKAVLLGSGLNCFNVEWKNQGFTFSESHDLRYGIVQKKVIFKCANSENRYSYDSLIYGVLTPVHLFSRVVLVEFWHPSKLLL